VGCGGGSNQLGSLIDPSICKGNVRASECETPIYLCSCRLDLNLSNPRVGGSNPPGRVEYFQPYCLALIRMNALSGGRLVKGSESGA